MKVMCIDDSPFIVVQRGNGPIFPLVYGSIYTVVQVDMFNGEEYYLLAEIYNSRYLSKRFVPLSDIDETKLVNEKIEAI